MEYEVFEPDPNDEYYDQMCSAAYTAMFNCGRSDYHANNIPEYPVSVVCNLSDG